MKALSVKNVGRKLLTLGVTALLATSMTSCGKDKKNKVDSSNTFNNTLPIGTGIQASNWENLKGQYRCNDAQGGRMSDMYFEVSASSGYGRLTGSMNQIGGGIPGQVTGTYFGKNANGTLLSVSTISDGGSNKVFVALSLCRYRISDPYLGNVEFIGENAGMGNFRLDVYPSSSIGCGIGSINDGYVTFSSQSYGGDVPTRFSPVNLNCN